MDNEMVKRICLKEWLLFLGIDQRDLSKGSGISENTISHIVQDRYTRSLRVSTIKKLAKGLGLTDPRQIFAPPPMGEKGNALAAMKMLLTRDSEVRSPFSTTVTLGYFKQQCLDSKVGRYCFLSPADIEVITGRAEGTVLNDCRMGLIRSMNPGDKFPIFDYPEVHAYLVGVGWIRAIKS